MGKINELLSRRGIIPPWIKNNEPPKPEPVVKKDGQHILVTPEDALGILEERRIVQSLGEAIKTSGQKRTDGFRNPYMELSVDDLNGERVGILVIRFNPQEERLPYSKHIKDGDWYSLGVRIEVSSDYTKVDSFRQPESGDSGPVWSGVGLIGHSPTEDFISYSINLAITGANVPFRDYRRGVNPAFLTGSSEDNLHASQFVIGTSQNVASARLRSIEYSPTQY